MVIKPKNNKILLDKLDIFKDNKYKSGIYIIYKDLLIYGYLNFSFEVLEYCDINSIAEREQYCICLFQPEYNIRCKSGKVYF